MIIQWKWLFEKVLTRFAGIMLFGFLFVKDLEDKELINHEKIHVRQFLEISLVAGLVFGTVAWFISLWFLLGIPVAFYIWYGIEFLIRLIKYRDREKSYKKISFEHEAYDKEDDFTYLQNRRFWRFWKYI
ncbi:hypothetical protein [Zunongwangia profunda]|uniref:hypothetical protein n=1 Tax=Zunongwangia profunda TaxID=398743 RepID=UPI00248E506A|nr:hypothetical protein [Zunongwangia profunda]|tara:strand:- start:85 stop:474 length:390 start_codon:yes stop_codon:yes gene_type:complete